MDTDKRNELMQAPYADTPVKRHRVEIKLTGEQKALILRGAALRGQGLSEFVRTCAEDAARELIRHSEASGEA